MAILSDLGTKPMGHTDHGALGWAEKPNWQPHLTAKPHFHSHLTRKPGERTLTATEPILWICLGSEPILSTVKRLEAFHSKLGIRQECIVQPLIFNIALEVLSRAIRQ